MKKFITLALSVAMIFSITACGKQAKNPNVSNIMSTIRSDIEFPDMGEIKKEALNQNYDFKPEQIEQIEQSACIIAGSGITTEEVLILKMKDKTDMDAIRKVMETRLKNQTELFKSYAPDEVLKLNSAVIEVKGNYAFFAITNTKDSSKAKKIFTDAV